MQLYIVFFIPFAVFINEKSISNGVASESLVPLRGPKNSLQTFPISNDASSASILPIHLKKSPSSNENVCLLITLLSPNLSVFL